jgi:AbrB family looped-hinge helix DNA binding protein
MSVVEITSMSSKGQIVIPAGVRNKLKIGDGTKFIVIQDGENILLKPIQQPNLSEFSKIIKMAKSIREELNLQESDIEKVIAKSRKV